MNPIVLLKDLTISGKGNYGIAASACPFNPSFPQYCRITDITDDGRYKPEPRVSIDPTEYPDFSDYYLRTGDIVFARTGNSTGRNYFYNPTDGKLIYAGFLIKFSLDPSKVIPEYVKYYCQTKQYFDWVAGVCTGSTRNNLNAQDYASLPIPIKTRSEQSHIVDILGSLDDKVENNERIVEKLDVLIMNHYREFIKQSDQFELTCMDDVFDISIGRTPPRAEPKWFSFDSNDVKWISIADMGKSFYFSHSTSEYLTNEAVKTFNVKVVPANTVLLSFKLTVGRVAITALDMTTNEAIAHFITDRSELREYLYCYLRNCNYDSLGSTSSIATAVNSKTIKSMQFLLPDASDLLKFHELTKPLFDYIKRLQIENQKLIELKQVYLKKFFD